MPEGVIADRRAGGLRWAIGVLWRIDRLFVLFSVVGGLAGMVTSAGQVWAIASLLANLAAGASIQQAAIPLAVFVACNAMGQLAAAWLEARQELSIQRITAYSAHRILRVASSASLIEFERPEFYNDLATVTEGLQFKPSQALQGLSAALTGLASALGSLIALWSVDWWVAAGAVFAVIAPGVALSLSARYRHKIFVGTVDDQRWVSYLTGIGAARKAQAEIRVFDYQAVIQDELRLAFTRIAGVLRHWLWRRVGAETAGLVVMAVAALALLLSFLGSVSGSSALVGVGVVVFSFQQLQVQLGQAGIGVGQVLETGPFLTRAKAILESDPAPRSSGPVALRKSLGEGRATAHSKALLPRIEARDVEFQYPEGPVAIRSFNFVFEPGKIYAIVGQNGSGKSTLLKVLARLFEPTSGAVVISGEAINSARDVSLCQQDFTQFEFALGTVLGGVTDLADLDRLGSLGLGIEDIVSRMPAGLDTQLGKSFAGGTDLSLGQWQRLALIRALVNPADFLFLDEPSAHLDRARTEAFTAFLEDNRSSGGITIVVTHSDEVASIADTIIVLLDGCVVDSGDAVAMRARSSAYFHALSGMVSVSPG